MTFKHKQGLWLWAGSLGLALLAIVPASGWARAVMALVIVLVVTRSWGRLRKASKAATQSLVMADGSRLPSLAYRQPVVLVCGDGLDALFGALPVEHLAVRSTAHGCYVRVPGIDQFPLLVATLLSERPHWGAQLSVMWVINPDEHSDGAVLAGQLRAFGYQLAQVRKRGLALPLILTSYLQATQGEGPWFSWEAGLAQPCVRNANSCVSLDQWQRQAADTATRAARVQLSAKLGGVAAWLNEWVVPQLLTEQVRSPVGLPLACAITMVPTPGPVQQGSLWRQWLRDRLGLLDIRSAEQAASSSLPFPDPLLGLLPGGTRRSSLQGAPVAAMWMLVVAAIIALCSSAWQNTLLARQVTDDLRRYHMAFPSSHVDRAGSTVHEEALGVLREDAARLDGYYRQGAPLSLGLGLYRGDQLRPPVLATIAGHRLPLAAPAPQTNADPVRLDSLSLFAIGSAQLKPESTQVLINALVGIKAQPGWLIVIAGHTDATGNADQNLQLSRARAAAVHEWFKRMGEIPDSCFAVQGFGASQPIASNDTEAGRAANRRVEIRLVPDADSCVLSVPGPGTSPAAATAAVMN